MNLLDSKISYCIINPYRDNRNDSENQKRCDNLESILYAKGYLIEPIKLYNDGVWLTSYLIWLNNEDIKDILFIINELNIDTFIMKSKGDSIIKQIDKKGFQKPLNIAQYSPDISNSAYIIKGLSYSFLEAKEYKIIESKSDLKTGMTVEIFNNNRWIEKCVENIDSEWDSIYKLFAKYSKLRTTI